MAKDLENSMNGNNVYILTDINPETTNELIMQLAQWVDRLEPKKYPEKIFTPYEIIPQDTNVLNVWINSAGGNQSQMLSLLNMFNIASAKGTIIKTYNIGRANSSASMIAVSGTRGYRFMYQDADNLIHYGCSRNTMNHPNELESINKDLKKSINITRNIYLNKTKLTDKEISKYHNIEGAGKLNATQCLNKGLCDWIITSDGRFIKNVAELLKTKQR